MRLTAIRGLAALIVVLHHAFLLFRVDGHDDVLHAPFDASDLSLVAQQIVLGIFNGQAAVVLFFVLSGCVLSLSLQRTEVTVRVALGFYIKRAFRILPAVWLAVAVSYVFLPYAAATHIPGISTTWMNIAYSRWPSPTELLRHLFAIDSFLDEPLWSLFIELFYSAMFPLLFLLTRDRRVIGVALIVSIVCLFLPFPVWRGLNYYLLAFVVGSGIANVAPAMRMPRHLINVIPPAAALLLLAARRVVEPIGGALPISILTETCASALIIYVVLMDEAGHRWLERRPLVFLGDISFSLYVLHFPLLFALVRLFECVVGVPFIAAHGMLSNAVIGVAAACVSIAAAAASFHFVERPIQQFGRRLARAFQQDTTPVPVRIT